MDAAYGKRKKVLDLCPNPLFMQWLTEWRDDAASKGLKSQYNYSKVRNPQLSLISIFVYIHFQAYIYIIFIPCIHYFVAQVKILTYLMDVMGYFTIYMPNYRCVYSSFDV